MIFEHDWPGWPRFDEDEIAAAAGVLRSGRVNYWTGEEATAFEREFAAGCGTAHAVMVANGTVAIELALHALGIGAGDEVVVPSRTFIATASAVVVRGARPVCADIDPTSQNITAATIEAVLSEQTRAIIVVHLSGWPCEMDEIMTLARARGLKVIEDCAQAHGARYRGRPVGGFGDIAAYSFCQDKIMTTGGEGGAVLTDDPDLWRRAWEYKDHGKSHAAAQAARHGPGFRWLHESFGTNWRMTEMQAAIGRVQLGKLESWVESRRRNAALLSEALQGTPGLRLLSPPGHVRHSYYKYALLVEPERLRAGWDRDRILAALTGLGVPCGAGVCPEIYLEGAFRTAGLGPAQRFPAARRVGETNLLLLVHPTLAERHMRRMADAVASVMSEAARG